MIPGETGIEQVSAIAIVGAALRFPGASDPASFHELTMAGRRMFRELGGTAPGDAQAHPGAPVAVPSRGAAILAALLDDDALHGRDDASGIGGHHVLAAETAVAALGDVPSSFPSVDPGKIGAFIADTPAPGTREVHDYVRWRLGLAGTATDASGARMGTESHDGDGYLDDPRHDDPGTAEAAPACAGAPGTPGAGLRGMVTVANGSMPSGPTCSLRAVTQACEALNAGKFDLVLAGGVATGIDTGWVGSRMAAGALASREVRVYDASPTGTLPGEGCGVIALVRTADAQASGLPVYAEIAGWHAADPAVERPALARAYQQAGVDPADVQFVEGHGAATAAEDLTELRSLLDLLGSAGAASRRCALGTVSANIGDTRSAAGIAALLKTALAMTADVIPPATGCVHPNRLLQDRSAPFRLPKAPEPWPLTPVQLAGVNSLGSASHPDGRRSGSVHLVLRRERDQTQRPGRRRRATAIMRLV